MNFANYLRLRPVQIVIIIIVTFILYLNALPNDFLYDDIKQVLGNKWITDIKYLPDILFSSTWGFDPTHTTSSYYRPMMLLVFMAEYSIFGLEPWGWHLTNIIFHALNGIIAFLLFSTLFRLHSKERGSTAFGANTLSLLGAILFIAHPARTEVVAWVSAIPELTFTFFLLLSLYFYILYRESEKVSLLMISALSFFLSTISKETSMALPILIVVFDLIFRGKARQKFRLPIRYIPYIIVVIIYFALRINALEGFSSTSGSHPYLSGFGYFINIFPIFIDHMLTLIMPINLSIFHVFNPLYSAGEFRAIASFISTIIIITVFWKLRRVDRLYLFAFALIVIPLLPALYIPALDRNPFAERYQYFSGTGFALIITLFFRETYNYHCKKQGERAIIYITIPFVILTTLYAWGTIKRNFDWKSRYTLWNSAVRVDETNYLALYNLGKYYLSIDDTDKAIPLLKSSINANSSRRDRDPLILGLSHLHLADSLRAAKKTDGAITHYNAVLKMAPMRYDANLSVAILYHGQGKLDLALTHYVNAVNRSTDKADTVGILMNIGNIHAKRKEYGKALEIYSQALEIMPDDSVLIKNMRLIREESMR